MSLRLQINLLIAALIAIFVAVVFTFDVLGTRSSVREEIQASNIVAAQLMSNFDWSGTSENSDDNRLALVNYLTHLGRVRATEISLLDASGGVVYRSPPSTYKAGRDAPAWYASLVAPDPIRQTFHTHAGDLVIEANASRAVLDGWDDAVRLFGFGGVIVLLGNLFVFWFVGRATRPFRTIVRGLEDMEAGEYGTRLPEFGNAEASSISRAFNRMGSAIQENLNARREALEANIRLDQSRELALMVQNRLEEERLQIARELHDDTGQNVTAIRILALSLVQRFDDKDENARNTAQLIADTAAKLYNAMHDLIPRLRPLPLENLGLAAALDEQVAEWRRQYSHIEFSLMLHSLPTDLGDSYLLAACRIVQEAVVNAIRHGHTQRIDISARTEGSALLLEIRDHGDGLSDDWQRPGHFGIRGMCERARMLGGNVDVSNASAGGVVVRATLPLN